MKRPGDWPTIAELGEDASLNVWYGYSADASESTARKLAAAQLDVPEDTVEVKWTGGCWLARKRQEND